MVDKDELRAFCRFLDEATDRELVERPRVFNQALDILPRGEARSDFLFLKRKLQQEQVCRLEVRLVQTMNQARQQSA